MRTEKSRRRKVFSLWLAELLCGDVRSPVRQFGGWTSTGAVRCQLFMRFQSINYILVDSQLIQINYLFVSIKIQSLVQNINILNILVGHVRTKRSPKRPSKIMRGTFVWAVRTWILARIWSKPLEEQTSDISSEPKRARLTSAKPLDRERCAWLYGHCLTVRPRKRIHNMSKLTS